MDKKVNGAHLAAKLPDGMRAFKIHLNKSVPGRILLHRGCVVDVLHSARLPGGDSKEEAMAVPLMQGIQVLSVVWDSVVTTPRNIRGVTLLVDRKQAEALQVASANGALSLTRDNGLDKKPGDMEATVLTQGKLRP